MNKCPNCGKSENIKTDTANFKPLVAIYCVKIEEGKEMCCRMRTGTTEREALSKWDKI